MQKDVSLDGLADKSVYSIKIKEAVKIDKEKYTNILAEVVFNMNKGEVSEPVKLRRSYVIFKLLDGPSYIPFKNVKNNIKFQLRNDKFSSYLNGLKDSAGVEIYVDNRNKGDKQ